ncbi:acyl-CoA carboxylase subunit epsilon [Streptomyces sp. NPDC003300]|uniref:acyl-CoA carboxylase subunit epsilon n=1 Tax=unclassified Streptomyces TaxID=2593676 RepID=UPI0033AF6448
MSGARDPDIRVVRGEPTAEELAALLAVWAGAGAPLGDEPAARRSPSRRSWRRGTVPAPDRGPGQWRRGGRSGGWTP